MSDSYGVPTGSVPSRAKIEQHGDFNKPGAAVKADSGKLMWALLPFKYLHGMVRVLMFGARKYDPHNWRKGMPWTQPYNAAIRHLDAWMSGEDIDPESGESHIDHAQCCLLFLRAYIDEHKGMDDRFKK